MSRAELIEKCLTMAEVDCFTKEQFKFREFMYDVVAFLEKCDRDPEFEWTCPSCGGKEYDSISLCMDCGCRMISKEVVENEIC